MGWVGAVDVVLVKDNRVIWDLSFVWNLDVSGEVVLVVNLWDRVEMWNWGESTDVIWVGISWNGSGDCGGGGEISEVDKIGLHFFDLIN